MGSSKATYRADLVRQVMTEIELLAHRTKNIDVTEEEIRLIVEKSWLPWKRQPANQTLLKNLEEVIRQREEELAQMTLTETNWELNYQEITMQNTRQLLPKWKIFSNPYPEKK